MLLGFISLVEPVQNRPILRLRSIPPRRYRLACLDRIRRHLLPLFPRPELVHLRGRWVPKHFLVPIYHRGQMSFLDRSDSHVMVPPQRSTLTQSEGGVDSATQRKMQSGSRRMGKLIE